MKNKYTFVIFEMEDWEAYCTHKEMTVEEMKAYVEEMCNGHRVYVFEGHINPIYQ